MRHSFAYLAALAAMLPTANIAMAFDPDTPVGAAVKADFPIQLDSEPDAGLEAAMFVAFGQPYHVGTRGVIERDVDGRSVAFTPATLHLLDDGRGILLSLGAVDGGSSESGINAIHYLRSTAKGWVREGEWFGVGAGGTHGNPAQAWAFTASLGKNLHLVTAGGGTWQGCEMQDAVVTEMTPQGPVDRGGFTKVVSSGAGIGQQDAEYHGVITAAKPDHSFVVSYQGTKALRQTYVLRDGKYQLVGRNILPAC